ncbi:MAG: hypothetical protein RIF32_00980, partial [Leptospirales bacterium]
MRKYTNENGVVRIPTRLIAAIVFSWGTLVAGPTASADPVANSFYVSIAGETKNSGLTPESPKRNIEEALALAFASGGGTVKITAGRFSIPATTLPANVTLEGGWNTGVDKQVAPFTRQATFHARQLKDLKPDADLCEEHTCITARTDDRVLTLNQPGARLSQLVVIGPDRVKNPGSSSYGVIVDGVDAKIHGLVIQTGTGGSGNNGASGRTGNGYCSNGGHGAKFKNTYKAADPFAPACDLKNHHGNPGDTVKAYGREANGGAGGKPAKSWCTVFPPGINEVRTGGTG